jgi:hypothetical protein
MVALAVVLSVALALQPSDAAVLTLSVKRRGVAGREVAGREAATRATTGRALQHQPPAVRAVGARSARQFNGWAYFIDIWVGSPGQRFGVQIDTGSWLLALPAAFCASCPAAMQGFSPNKSRSANALGCEASLCDGGKRAHLLGVSTCSMKQGEEVLREALRDSPSSVRRAVSVPDPHLKRRCFRTLRVTAGATPSASAYSTGLFKRHASIPVINHAPHYTLWNTACTGATCQRHLAAMSSAVSPQRAEWVIVGSRAEHFVSWVDDNRTYGYAVWSVQCSDCVSYRVVAYRRQKMSRRGCGQRCYLRVHPPPLLRCTHRT